MLISKFFSFGSLNRLLFALACCVLATFTTLNQARGADFLSVTDLNGQTASVEVIETTRTEAKLNIENIGQRTVKFAELTKESAKAILDYAEKNNLLQLVPPLVADVSIGRKNRRLNGSSFMKTMTITPHATIKGKNSLDPIPALKATMIILTVDTRSKYVNRRESYMVGLNQTQPLPAMPDGKPRKITFDEFAYDYDSDRDSSNSGGYVYKYYVLIIRDAKSGAVVFTETTYHDLSVKLEMNPELGAKLIKIATSEEEFSLADLSN